MSRIDQTVDLEMDGLVSDLQSLVRQPSVSSKGQGLEECAQLIAEVMRRGGISCNLLRLEDRRAPPIIYGEVKSRSNPRAKTILFYNHYDVQPVEPIEGWNVHPFSGAVRGGKIFGRGAADDKGELITRIKAVEYYLRSTGDVPCNVKFLVEGEEEVGSPNLERYLLQFNKLYECNGIIWELGYVDAEGRPVINLGMKGVLYVELTASGPSNDLHSSFAVLVQNPAWRLIKGLNSIWDDKEAKILIKDWYKEVRSFTKEDLSFMGGQPSFDEPAFKKKYGVARFLKDMTGEDVQRALAGSPTGNISGLVSGHLGKGAKTILPSFARAKLDFRLVPDMIPRRQFERLEAHLREGGFTDIAARYIHGIQPYRTEHRDRFVRQVEEAAGESFGRRPMVNLSSAGTGPMSVLAKILMAPCVAVGSTFIFANIHSVNEFARIDLLNKGTKCIGNILEMFASA